MKRLFVAVDLPETIKTALAQLAAGIPGARWTEPPQIHLTLRFIGDVDGAQFADIREALAEVNALAFALSLSGTDHFASQQTPRTFWAGVAPSLELERLHADVERALSSAGLKPERHKFIPHVTLARLKRAPLERVRRTPASKRRRSRSMNSCSIRVSFPATAPSTRPKRPTTFSSQASPACVRPKRRKRRRTSAHAQAAG